VLASGEKLEEDEDVFKPFAVETLASTSCGSAPLREVLKESMRRVPQPVAIITSAETYGDSKDFRGATISSFNTVSLDPEPIVSFNIGRQSSTFDAIKASERFWVHFLTLEQSAAELAQRFTRGNRRSLFGDLEMEGRLLVAGGITVRYPQIRGLQGAKKKGLGEQIAMVLECIYLKDKTVTIGDHAVLFGTVTGITSGESKSDTVQSGPCLVYANGTYHGLLPL
jgi:flavin reductase (DIM6/NTAB) family NADH-FMN oxidoreductase RutF